MRASSVLTALATLSLVIIAACPAVTDEATLSVGPWTAEVRDGDLRSLTWNGQPLALGATVRGYLPGWEGTRFTVRGGELNLTEDAIAVTARDPGNQEVAVNLTLTPERARYELRTTIHAAGPTEFGMTFDPTALSAERQFFLWTEREQLRTLALDDQFETLSPVRELRFMQEERTVIVRCNGFQLQDRRDRGGGLLLVSVIGSSGDGPTEAERWIEIEVEAAPEEEIAGRRQLLTQVATEIAEIEVHNGGFEAEEPLSAWSRSPLARVDREIARSGEASARLDVERPIEEGESIYLIQQVPLQAGLRYRAEAWIRGEDVRPAVHRGMPPAGATIIIEFADQEGRWMSAGSYAAAKYGTFDWERLNTDAAVAPPGAGYAVIYLALRGLGTAWFDDVRLEEVRHNVVLLDPIATAPVHDNTPRLRWHYEQQGLARMELSRDPTFPADATRVFEDLMASELTVTEPIEPGSWHWRVSVPEYAAISATWSFEQTAGLDEDTTEPQIAREHGWLDGPTAPVRVSYSDNVGVEEVRMVVNGHDVSEQTEAGAQEAVYRPREAWSEGLQIVEVQVADAAGNSAEETLFFTHGAPPQRITWLEHEGLQIGEQRRFLLGMYGVNLEQMAEMAEAGFDYVHSYRWDGSGDLQSALEYLDAAQEHGLMVFLGLDRRRLMAQDERFVAERVAALMRHPALLAWYLFDEPDLQHQYVSPQWLQRYYELIRALDPFRPVVVTCAGDAAVPRYRDAMDVHWTQVYSDTARVAARMQRHREALHPGTPVAAILHCYDRVLSQAKQAGEQVRIEEFQPDGRMMRANAYMALAHRSSGLLWWWWGYGPDGPRWVTVAEAPEAWASLRETVAEIRSLEPVLVADGEVTTQVIEAAEGVEVHLWEKRLADRVVTIAVNRDAEEVEVAWTPATPPADGIAREIFEEREVRLREGQIMESFEARGVRVYEWPAQR